MGSHAEEHARRNAPMSPVTVRVDCPGRGARQVAMPNQRERVTCETLEDARRLTHLCAAPGRPCELIVCDAYHLVLHQELINGHTSPACTGGRIEEPAR
jgi:hypothetical protein